MHLLTRISLQNWYLLDALDIDIRGATALIGPTGAGKSSIQDAIQTVIAGNNQNRLHLNASASGRSQRSVRDYCLGFTMDPSEGGKPLRDRCETVVALVFRDEETAEPITVGLAFEARETEQREEVLSRFIAKGYAYSVESFRRSDGEGDYMAPWSEISQAIRAACPGFEEYRTSAERFTSDMLTVMSGPGHAPNARHFLRAFANALAFKPIFDPTTFVRDYILEPDPLDVERVRTSIATWQGFVATIEDLEAKLRRLQRIEKRFRDWGRANVRAANARWTTAAAQARRLAADHAALVASLRERTENLTVERRVMTERRAWVKGFEHDIRSKRALLQESDASARIRAIEFETAECERDRRDAESQWADISSALSEACKLEPLLHYVTSGPYLQALRSAALAGVFVSSGRPAAEALRGRSGDLDGILASLAKLAGLEEHVEALADDLADQIRKDQAEVEELEAAQARIGDSAAPLSTHTVRFIRELREHGIDSVPLCDVVEVVDEEWRPAVEALLGRAREALIVPEQRLREAHDVMHARRAEFFGCMLVKAAEKDSAASKVPGDSVMVALHTSNARAHAFLSVRIGQFRKAETEADLARMPRAVMRNGKSTSGMTLGVHRDVREFMLGRSAREQSAEAIRSELEARRADLASMRSDLKVLREAARTVPSIVATLKRCEAFPSEIERALRDAEVRMRSLRSDLEEVEKTDGGKLVEQIREAESSRDLYAKELEEEIEPRVEELQRLVMEAQAKIDVHRSSLKEAVKAKAAAYRELLQEDVVRVLELDEDSGLPSASELMKHFRQTAAKAGSKGLRALMANMRSDAKAVAESAEVEAKREGSGAIRELTEYVANWRIDFPFRDGSPASWGYDWVSSEREKLERNELRAYHEHCRRAEAEMRQMLKEDLLTKLAEKFEKVRIRLDVLNQRLDRHRFTGQRYSFESMVNQRYQKVHMLASQVAASPERAQAILSGEASLDDPLIDEAMQEIQLLIEGKDETKNLSDYRNYFTFELYMTDPEGKRTSMSSRAVRGSGGEAQAPFYVAIAASLASAYYPGAKGLQPNGMGLVLFDEAFNKLDIRNTQALLSFFKDIGLQLMIAAPEDKRATFTEVLETIVTVNKSPDGRSAYVDSEFPGDMAREALAAINPDRMDISLFRTIAAE